MKLDLNASSIACTDFRSNLGQYDDYVPEKIQGLEELRLSEVPKVLEQRRKDGDAFLEKTEAVGLVEWKLKHGTYRPNLAKQVASNSIEDVRTTTRDAFAAYEADRTIGGHVKAVATMSKLKGVGPATASLFLSCYDPINVSFFSDELYRYLHWEEARLKGWDRKINYTMKEYKELCTQCQTLRSRLESESKVEVRAIDIEKMAYALAKRAQQASSLGKREEDGNIKELQPPSPKKRRKATPPLSEDPMSICLRKGPLGSPTYDNAGFELDYDYLKKCAG